MNFIGSIAKTTASVFQREQLVAKVEYRPYLAGLFHRRVTVQEVEKSIAWDRVCMVGGLAVAGYGLYRLRQRLCRRSKVFIDPMMVKPESLVPGSTILQGGSAPSCQARVAMGVDDGIMVVGSGIRVENYLITPTHNGHANRDLWVLHPRDDELAERVDRNSEILLAPDVSAFALSESQWARLQVPRARLGPLASKATVQVTGGLDGTYSIGEVLPGPTMGRMQYTASTMPGYSGSAYQNGSVTLGMHCHGGTRGGGYEMLYLYARLKAALKQRPEDSSVFFGDDGREDDFQEEDLGDEYIVRNNRGQYGVFGHDEWEQRTRGSRYKAAPAVEVAPMAEVLATRQRVIDRGDTPWDAYPESGLGPVLQAQFSGESQRPSNARPSIPVVNSPPPVSLSSVSREPLATAAGVLSTLIGSLSERQLSGLTKYAQSLANEPASKQRKTPTVPQIVQARPNGGVSNSNSQKRQSAANKQGRPSQ